MLNATTIITSVSVNQSINQSVNLYSAEAQCF